MTHTCGNCNRTFPTSLELALHRDRCTADRLVCRRCGERFDERTATRDGWHFECPNDDCDGTGIGEDLVRLEAARVGVQ